MLLTGMVSPIAVETALSMRGLCSLDALGGTCCTPKKIGSSCESSKQFPVLSVNAMC